VLARRILRLFHLGFDCGGLGLWGGGGGEVGVSGVFKGLSGILVGLVGVLSGVLGILSESSMRGIDKYGCDEAKVLMFSSFPNSSLVAYLTLRK
jgi:hypothetical protein